jgi:porphobilinogen synthase
VVEPACGFLTALVVPGVSTPGRHAKIPTMSTFPATRLRRLRRTAALRGLVRETRLDVQGFIYPLFVCPGEGIEEPLPDLTGIARRSIDRLCDEAAEAAELGIPAIMVFGIPEEKDEVGSDAYADDGIVQRALRALRERVPELVLVTDVCLCEYTSHGHCGLVRDDEVLNDLTIELLARTAVSHVEAGADAVAPSDMMDGRVGAIRGALDSEGHENVPIIAYSAKFASAFYGPFREVADSAPSFGDRRTYQMDPANAREALRECALDVDEGADVIMIKPALPYLDLVAAAKARFDHPIAAYSVSGEYAMLKAAAANGWLDERRAVLEVLTGIKRAGADIIVTYFAKEAASWLRAG